MGPKKTALSKRSLRSGDSGHEKRPKRVVQNKTVDDAVGLSRQEEQELNKALYASLNETRRSKSMSSLTGLDVVDQDFTSRPRSSGLLGKSSLPSKGNKITLGKKRSLRRGGEPLAKRLFRSDSTGSSEDNLNIDESSKDSVKSSSSSGNGSKKKIHAQRKFAQGCSLPGTPMCSPTKASTTPVKLLSRTPKTEDFLTFLCLRGSPALPPHLDFFNFSKEELPLRDDSPKASWSGRRKQIHQSCLDEHWSSSSGASDEVVNPVGDKPPSAEKCKVSQAKGSAARASAGTLETARGIASLRQGLQPKGSSVGASTPISSPASNNQSRSSQKRSGGDRSRRHHAPSTIEVLKSARKNLLGKLTSVARQSEKMSPNPRKKSPNSKKGRLLSRGGKSLSEGVKVHRRGLRERRSKITKEYSDDDDDDDDDVIEKEDYGNYKGRRKSSKINEKYKGRRVGSKKVKPLKRRVSERLKMLLQSPHSRRRRLISEDEDEDFPQEQKIRVKKDSEKGSGTTPTPSPKSKSVDSNSSPNTSQSPARSRRDKNESSHRKDPQRKSFKIRPLERVRTRGYSSMLASKLALKKAKTRDDKRGLNVSDGRSSNSGGNRMDGGSDASDNLSNSGGKTGSGSGNISSSSSSNSGGKSSSGNVDDIAMPNKDGDKVTEKDVKQSPTLGRLTAGARRESTDKQQRESASVKEVKSSGVLTPGTKDLKVKVTGSGRKSDSPSLKLTHLKKVKSSTSTSRPSSAASSTSSTSTCKTPWLSSSQSIPTFHPSESDFADPMAYIARIQPEAEPYGMCKIIPPASWKLDSSKVNEDIRFTPQVQYIHRLYNRWGPNVQRTAAINYHLLSELSGNTVTPQIGGVEIDLPQLYGLVDEAGGLSKMADKKHWANVADAMNIPKQAMDRTMRLYDIYCRHVLPYATLSRPERYDLEEEVKAIHELQTLEDEAIIRGKSMSLSYFSKVARNVQSMWFKDDPSPDQVEREYWGLVEEGEKHVAVQCGHINTLTQASAFPTKKDSPYSKHPWNLNQIPNHDACVLKYLGPVAGTTIPTMHLGMLFSTSCWSSDPHGLPYIQYHHSGGDIIWYCISKSQRCKFRSSMMELASSLISNKPRWLKEDCVMVNPGLLREKGVKVGRCVHKAREFVVIFPGAHTATITCGFSVSESVHFATTKWLPFGIDSAVALTKSGEKELFAMSSLLCRLAQDKHIDLDTLTEALPLLSSIIYKELDLRTQLHAVGLRSDKKMLNLDTSLGQIGVGANKKRLSMSEEEKTCEICSRICHLSMVYVEQEEQILCLEHGLRNIQKRKNAKSMRLFVLYNQLELETILKGAKDRLVVLSSPKAFNESGDGVGSSKTRGGTSKQ